MDCFTHQGSVAIGTCKACSRAVCRGCAQDLVFALACSDSCAREAREQHEVIARSKALYGIGGKRRPFGFNMATIIYGLFTLVFGGAALINLSTKGSVDPVLGLFGIVFAIITVIAFLKARRIGIRY